MEEPISQEQPVTPELLIPDRGQPICCAYVIVIIIVLWGAAYFERRTWMQIIRPRAGLFIRSLILILHWGIVGFASAIPTLLISPWGGLIVTGFPSGPCLSLTQTGANAARVYPRSPGVHQRSEGMAHYSSGSGFGCGYSFDAPGRQAFVVDMVGREDLPNAIALNSMMFNSARIIGPAMGGYLLAVIGPAWCFYNQRHFFFCGDLGLWQCG